MKVEPRTLPSWHGSNVMRSKDFQQFMAAADRAKQYQQIKGLNERNKVCQPK